MLRIAVLVVVLGQALAMPELGSSGQRLRRQTAPESGDYCQRARQCGETFTATFNASSSSDAHEQCGFFSSYIACLQTVVGQCPTVVQVYVDLLSYGQMMLCSPYAWGRCTVAFSCAVPFMDMQSGNYGNAGSNTCSNAQTYKNCLATYQSSCPWIDQLYIMGDAEYRLGLACGDTSKINKWQSIMEFIYSTYTSKYVPDVDESVSAIQDSN
ncbi:uncharacterized protein [Haliotis cracherodii]|uniref:uncharacterized protein n=1 Tax=Haliotis cracherodii TaxID=6455 RepID=UPI0039ED677E